MEILFGLESPSTLNKVCKLWKSLYSLKKFPRVWFERLTWVFKEDGYIQGQSYHTMFVKHSLEGEVTLFIVYVNDIVITRDDHEKIKHLKELLAWEFEVKDLGKLKYFLDMEVAHTKEVTYAPQKKYTLDLL